MQKMLLLTILICPVILFAQHNRKLTLILSTGDCRLHQNVRIGFQDTICFYQDGSLYKKIIPMNYNRWPIRIEGFNGGEYNVTYENIYGQKINKLITIPANAGEYKIDLCPDELKNYSKNSLAMLRNGEAVRVSFHSSGCFHNVEESLLLRKHDQKISATLLSRGKTKSIILNDLHIEAFIRFENELEKLNNGGLCTTTDTYNLVSKKETLKKTDGHCVWNGFYFLKKAFFGDHE